MYLFKRMNFKIPDFVKRNNLSAPIAGNYFLSRCDPSVEPFYIAHGFDMPSQYKIIDDDTCE